MFKLSLIQVHLETFLQVLQDEQRCKNIKLRSKNSDYQFSKLSMSSNKSFCYDKLSEFWHFHELFKQIKLEIFVEKPLLYGLVS